MLENRFCRIMFINLYSIARWLVVSNSFRLKLRVCAGKYREDFKLSHGQIFTVGTSKSSSSSLKVVNLVALFVVHLCGI